MAYTRENFRSKKLLKAAVMAGRKVSCYQPGPFGGNIPENGKITLEGPHYPEPHRWYAEGFLENGFLVKIR